MWQCKYCRERFLEEDPNHICVSDELSRHFRGRLALLEPLFRAFVQRLNRLGGITARSENSFIALSSKHTFAIVRITQDHLDICLRLPDNAPISPKLLSASRLRLPGMTHYFTVQSIGDLTPDIMRSLMWAKEAAEKV